MKAEAQPGRQTAKSYVGYPFTASIYLSDPQRRQVVRCDRRRQIDGRRYCFIYVNIEQSDGDEKSIFAKVITAGWARNNHGTPRLFDVWRLNGAGMKFAWNSMYKITTPTVAAVWTEREDQARSDVKAAAQIES
jgi:hypothetical protein